MNEGEMRTIEQEIGATIPSAYRSFVQRFGACTVSGVATFSTIDRLPQYITRDGRALFGTFFGASSETYDESNSLVWNVENYKDRIPDWLLPIADDGGGDILCLAVSGPDRGKVYFWDMRQEMGEVERNALGVSDRHKNIYLVADSFDEFLYRLSVSS
jgi:hypothetical protein